MSTHKITSTDNQAISTRVESGVSSLLLGMILIGLSYSLMLAFSREYSSLYQVIALILALFTTIVISIAYFLSRKGYTTLAGIIAASTSALAVLGIGAFYSVIGYWYLLYLVFPIVLACLLLNQLQSTIFTLSSLAGAITVYFLNWSGDYIQFLSGPMVFLFAGSGLIFTANNYFQKSKLKHNLNSYSSTGSMLGEDSITEHLVGITNRTNQIKDPETLFNTLAGEFQKLSFDFGIILIEPGTNIAYIKYNSINVPLLKIAQKKSGISFGNPRKNIEDYHSIFQPVFQEGKNQYVHDFLDVLVDFIPIPEKISLPSLNILGISKDTKGGILPMLINEEIIGAFIIWGDDFQEADLPACKVFAGQIASNLEKANLGESEMMMMRNLIRTNSLLRALNSLSAKIASTVDIDDVYTLLGGELNTLGYKCIITLMEPDQQTAYIQYTTETQKISKIERLLGIKILGREFTESEVNGGFLWSQRSGEPHYTTGLYDYLLSRIPRVPIQVKRKALSIVGIRESTPAFILPLINQNQPIGSLTIWGGNVMEDDLPTFKIFADQIANMFEKARLAKLESKRAQEQVHSYSLVNSLSTVSVKLTSTTDTEKLFEILGREIKNLNYNCMVSKLEKGGNVSTLEFINIDFEIIEKIEFLTGTKLIGYEFPSSRWPESLQSVYLRGQNVFIPKLIDHIEPLFPKIPKALRVRALEFVGINGISPAIYVPMSYGEEVIGSIAFWGESLDQEDVPAFSVFGSQLANALKNAKLVDAEQERTRELEQTNSLLNTLSEVAIDITSVNDPDNLFPILGNKLKNNGYFCAVTLIDPDYTNAQIHYTNADIKLVKLIEQNLKIKILGKNFSRDNMTQKDIDLYEQETKVFLPKFIDHLYQLFSPTPKVILDQGAKILEITKNTPAVYVPMVHQELSVGAIMVWGENLREEDLPAFSVLGSQVANALVNTRLMDKNLTEIVSRKKAQKALEISRQELQGIFDHAHDAIIIINAEGGDILSVNNRACELYGINQKEFICSRLDLVFDEEYLVEKLIKETIKNGFCNKLVTHYTNNHHRMTFEINSSVVEYEGKLAIQCINRDVTEQKEYEDQLKHAALHDTLTGLPNRSLFIQHLEHAIARCDRYPNDRFTVIYLDLDNFKRINDSLGHSVGDQIIIKVAQRIKESIRATDTPSRFGGDEFVILLEDTKNIDVVYEFCERFLINLTEPITIEGHEVVVSSSVGIVYSSPKGKNAEEYLRNADLAMYQSKKSGKNKITLFRKGMHTGIPNELTLENQIRGGINKQEFKLYYQPINSLQSGSVISYEALVRWDHQERGIISPGEFIPVAEFSGLIHPLGKWILEEACRQFQKWREAKIVSEFSTISVNISAIQLMHAGFVDQICKVLDDTGLPPDRLNLEVTETALITNPTDARTKLKEVREHGVKIHLDDFGTGFSSLSFLTTFPIDAIKIDRQFIMSLHEEKNYALVESMQLLTKALGISLIAEGIETADQLNKLVGLSCEFGQGFYFAKPCSGEDFGISSP